MTLKDKLLQKIASISDEKLLEELHSLLEDADSCKVYPLTPNQKSIVEESSAEVKRGKFISGKDADEAAEQWLRK